MTSVRARRRRAARHARRRREGENTIPLINVVFLLLVFFLVAGQLSAPRDIVVEMATAGGFDPAAMDPVAIYVDAEGTTRVAGEALDAADAVAAVAASVGADAPAGAPEQLTETLTVIPDHRLDASTFLATVAELRSITASNMRLLVRRSQPRDADR